MRKSISEKELGFISELELKQMYFFTRDDIRQHFTSDNEMSVYIHRLKKKKRIIKINKSKYYLIPVKATKNNWSEHPYIIIDEIMNGKEYCITGKTAAHYWKLIDQIPFIYEVSTLKKSAKIKIFNATISFKKKRIIPKNIENKIYGHKFIIATKKEAKQWI